MSNKAIKYRIIPSEKQKELFVKTFGCCRKIYNLMLADKVKGYEETGLFPYTTPAMYKKEYPYLKEVDSLALANKQRDLEAAFKNRFSKTRKTKCGFPKFKSAKTCRKSYTTNNQHGTIAIIDDKYIRLPKVGKVKAIIHRQPGKEWVIKSATVSQESDGTYYISILFEFEAPKNDYVPDKNNSIGLDYASSCLYIDSNGEAGSEHRYFRESQKKLAKAQRKLSRKRGFQKGEEKSANYKKQLRKVNKGYVTTNG